MLIKNISKRRVAAIQATVSALLILLSFVFSMLPLININTDAVGFGESGGTLKESIMETVEEVTGSPTLSSEIGDKISVSPIGIIRSFGMYFRISGASANNSLEAADALRAELETESGIRSLITVSAITAIISRIREGSGGENMFAVIFKVIIGLLGFIIMLILALALPVILLVKAILAVITFIRGVRTPEAIAGKLGGSLQSIILIPLFLMLIQSVCPGISAGFGAVAVLIFALCCALINALITRAREYNKDELIYLNIVQGSALISLAGFLIFFFNLLGTGALTAFVSGDFIPYLAEIESISANDPSLIINNSYIFTGVLMIAYALLAAIAVSLGDKLSRRISLAGAAHSGYAHLALFAVICCVAPFAVSGSMHLYLDPTSTAPAGDASFLPEGSFNSGSLGWALAGAVIMLVGEVLSVVLSKVLSGGLSREDKKKLLSGKAMAEYMDGE